MCRASKNGLYGANLRAYIKRAFYRVLWGGWEKENPIQNDATKQGEGACFWMRFRIRVSASSVIVQKCKVYLQSFADKIDFCPSFLA